MERRSFLKSLGIGIAVVSIAPALTIPEEKQTPVRPGRYCDDPECTHKVMYLTYNDLFDRQPTSKKKHKNGDVVAYWLSECDQRATERFAKTTYREMENKFYYGRI